MSKKIVIEDRLIDDKELCELLGWSPATPPVMRARGTMPFAFIRVGTRIRYRMSAVNAYLDAQTVQPSAKTN